MDDFLLTLGALTLGGSAAILLLSLASRSTRSRYGARWRCWAWLLLCLRLALPFSLLPQGQREAAAPIQLPTPSDPVIYQSHPGVGNQTAPPSQSGDAPGQTGGQGAAVSSPSAGGPPAVQPEPPREESFSLSLSQLAGILWLAGAAVMVLWAGLAHLRFLRYLRRWSSPAADSGAVRIFNQLGDSLGLDRRPRLLVCQGLKVPMLAGLLRPVLLLPQEELSEDSLRYSLLHELTHFRRRDIWLKTLALWVNALHWFNPLAWYMVRLVERDTELACDEAALNALSPEEHAAYGQTILSAVSRLKKEKP